MEVTKDLGVRHVSPLLDTTGVATKTTRPTELTRNDEEDRADVSSVSSMSSTEILASSPLYYVLQEFLLSQSGSTITDEVAGIAQSLHSISRSLSLIARSMQQRSHRSRSNNRSSDKRSNK